MAKKKDRNIGSSLDDFLKDEGLYEEVTAGAVKWLLARDLKRAMDAANITKSELARRMNTSRTQVDRLLDPDITSIQLETLYRAASAVGKQIRLELS